MPARAPSRVERLQTAVYRIPTERLEADCLHQDDGGRVPLERAIGELPDSGAARPGGRRLRSAVDIALWDLNARIAGRSLLAYGFGVPFSAHTAPSIHAHAACAVPRIAHVEYFFDHVRIERMLFDGVLQPANGCLRPDQSRPGLGLELKRAEAERWRVSP